MSTRILIDVDLVDAVVFDLDGVLTDTADLHARAWTELFNTYFPQHADVSGIRVAPFDPNVDYPKHLDGRLRDEGVAAVLASRGIALPRGTSSDAPGDATVWALANQKQEMFRRLLGSEHVAVVPGAVTLVRALRRAGIRTGLVSASRNADDVLAASGLDRFGVRVDGVEAERLGLPGKPDPASFREAATRLKVPPDRAVVIEDSLAGVAAAAAGGFRQVIGVGTGEHAAALIAAGATATASDLTEVDVIERFACCATGHAGAAEWVLPFDGIDTPEESRREALCSTGNGYLATRGTSPESPADGLHYPGTYLAGVYNRLTSTIMGEEFEHEDLVNVPNWLLVTFRIGDGDWFDADGWQVLSERWELDIRHGILVRRLIAHDAENRSVAVEQRRLVSVDNRHLAVLHTRIIPRGWSGRMTIQATLDGDVANAGVREYRHLAECHLTDITVDEVDPETVLLIAETTQSRVRIAQAARLRIRAGAETRQDRSVTRAPAHITQHVSLAIEDGEAVEIDKVVAVFTSRDTAISECGAAAQAAAVQAKPFDEIVGDHRAEWERLWATCAIWLDVEGRTSTIVNLHVLHLLQALSPRHSVDLDAGVTPRGLSGEAYRGHVFWDELFIFPFFNLRFPELSRSLLLYRYRRLDHARLLARRSGHHGAMFPWQSGSDGREETPRKLFNVRSGRWVADNSHRQRHVGLAIAYNVWKYFQVTGDVGFLRTYGAELLIEISRFWSSIAVRDPETDRYDIAGVMGPDEFHDGGPQSPGAGVTNNTYTNVMTAWVLARTLDAVNVLGGAHGGELWDRLDLRHEELERWEQLSRTLNVEFDAQGRLTQFRGYDDLIEFDWDRYRTTYSNIGRLDLILESEGDSTNRYKLSKQADVLMLFYLFTAEELTAVLDRLGYDFDPDSIPETVRYFLARTSHGSTLSRVAHAWVLARTDRERSWRLLLEALASDVDDTQGGTTGEGIHLGAMGGTVDVLQRCYTGLDIREDTIHLNPRLPDELPRLRFEVVYRGHRLELDITRETLTVRSRPSTAAPISLQFVDQPFTVRPGETHEYRIAAR